MLKLLTVIVLVLTIVLITVLLLGCTHQENFAINVEEACNAVKKYRASDAVVNRLQQNLTAIQARINNTVQPLSPQDYAAAQKMHYLVQSAFDTIQFNNSLVKRTCDQAAPTIRHPAIVLQEQQAIRLTRSVAQEAVPLSTQAITNQRRVELVAIAVYNALRDRRSYRTMNETLLDHFYIVGLQHPIWAENGPLQTALITQVVGTIPFKGIFKTADILVEIEGILKSDLPKQQNPNSLRLLDLDEAINKNNVYMMNTRGKLPTGSTDYFYPASYPNASVDIERGPSELFPVTLYAQNTLGQNLWKQVQAAA